MDIDERIMKVLGEPNLYKIDRFKYPDKKCRHYEMYVCKKCADELMVEEQNIMEKHYGL